MSMSKCKVLLLGTIDHAHEVWSSFSSTVEIITPKSTNRADFIAECKSGAFDGVVAVYRTFASIAITSRLDDELLSALPKSVKVIAHNGAGYDHFHIPSFSKHSILATNVPTAVDDATADTGLFLMLGALRNFRPSFLALTNSPHTFRPSPAPALGRDPEGGKVLGILGMGGIGRNFVRKCRPFGMKVIYHNRRRLADPTLEEGATYVSFEEVLKQSDILSVHVPLNEHTRHLLGKKELAMCKKGVCIVNTARGAVIDEAALVEALESGHVGSVGLDVFEEEPKVHEGLLKNERAFLLPFFSGNLYLSSFALLEILRDAAKINHFLRCRSPIFSTNLAIFHQTMSLHSDLPWCPSPSIP